MTIISPLHVSEPGCHPHGLLLVYGTQDQHANLGIASPLLE